MNFLTLLQEGIILSYSSKGQLIHQIDLVRLRHPFILVNVEKSISNHRQKWKEERTLKSLTMIGKVAEKSMT